MPSLINRLASTAAEDVFFRIVVALFSFLVLYIAAAAFLGRLLFSGEMGFGGIYGVVAGASGLAFSFTKNIYLFYVLVSFTVYLGGYLAWYFFIT